MAYLTALTSTLALLATSVRAAPAPSRFSFYTLPTPESGPCDMVEGHDGMLYIQNFLVDTLVRLDPSTGVTTEYQIPYNNPPAATSVLPGLGNRTALACAIRPGDDGLIYAASGVRNEIVQLDPATGMVKVFAQPANDPLGDLQPFNDMWPGPTGMFFSQTTGNVISLFNYDSHTFQNYPVPTPLSGPLGMRLASDGALWFTEFIAQKIGRLNYTSGSITEYPIPTLDLSLLGPAVLRVEEDPYLYFTGFVGDGIGRIDIHSGEIDSFPYTVPAAFPAEDTQDPKGNVWFSTATQNTIQYLTPSTGKFTTIPLPDTVVAEPGLLPNAQIGITYGPGNAIWFAELSMNRIGRYALS
ncbi:hypothetical protein LTR62_000037 [Meristemomyces frigidus]|uniref:SMP-30/Gluconolactonase/LRE-like region domain-containing protein n=1 Tax=Meristemomyces frigidus TaxID=1508187 RepID=A0AAN7YSU4_9PEZI|nr:hypothetical protein LTR62_000037 [Meristemomyces frigidus]